MATATYDPNGLIAGDYPILTRTITLKSGQNLDRGALIGEDGSGKFLLSAAASEDGSEDPKAVLAFAVDASGGDKVCKAYFTGEFNAAKMVFGAGYNAASAEAALRAGNIPIVIDILP